MTLTLIQVKLQVEGVHNWPNCDIEEVDFLKHPHRHIFYIECCREVFHDDRDVEFIAFKRTITNYLEKEYSNGKYLDFKNKSCEMIAHELLSTFNLDSCYVSEDNENGAIVHA